MDLNGYTVLTLGHKAAGGFVRYGKKFVLGNWRVDATAGLLQLPSDECDVIM